MSYDRRALKEKAKAAMRVANPKPWLVTLVFQLLLGVLPGTVGTLAPNPLGEYAGAAIGAFLESGRLDHAAPKKPLPDMVGMLGVGLIFSVGVFILIVIFRALMTYGYRDYALKIYRREPYVGVGSLFRGFSRFGGAVGGTLLVTLFSLLWGVLIYGVDISLTVLLVYFAGADAHVVWVAAAILFLAAALLHTLVVCRYCLVPYLIMDNKKMSASQAIAVSVRTMRGNVLKRFALWLSFLSWELLRGLIAAATAVLASVVVLLVTGGSMEVLAGFIEQGSLTMSRDAQFVTAMLILIVAVLIVFGLTLLVQMPLELWLTSYRNVAYAGFFQEIVGGVPQTVPMTPLPSYVPPVFNNGQPPVPGPYSMPEAVPAPAAAPYTPFGGQVETAPYVPFGADAGMTQLPEEPQAPAAPAPLVPEDPQPPAAPAAFVPEEPQTPAVPAAPEPEGPRIPGGPEDPEN